MIVHRWQKWRGKTATRQSDRVALDDLGVGGDGSLKAHEGGRQEYTD